MRRKAALERLQAIARLRAVLRSSGDSLACQLARRTAAPGEEGFSYRPVIAHLHAELAAVEQELTAAEDGLADRKSRCSGLRQDQADAACRLYRRQDRTRKLLLALPDGRHHLKHAGLAAAPPQAAPLLIRHAARMVDLLRKLERTAPQPTAGLTLDYRDLADNLTADLDKLRAAFVDVEEARPDVTISRWRANEAIAEADHVLPCVARILENLSRLAGQQDLADRVRSAARR